MERIGIEILANFVDRVIRGHQLVPVREVDAIHAGVHVRRATDHLMNFFSSGFFEVIDARFASSAADDRVIHDDHALALHQFRNEVQLHAHVEVANQL